MSNQRSIRDFQSAVFPLTSKSGVTMTPNRITAAISFLVLYLVSLPANLLSFLVVGVFIRALWGRDTFRVRGSLWIDLRMSWLASRPFFREFSAITLGHVVLAEPLTAPLIAQKKLLRHELVHIEQYEALHLLLAVVNGAWLLSGGPLWTALTVQALGGYAAFLLTNIAAWLRREPLYSGSHLEEGAPAQEGQP